MYEMGVTRGIVDTVLEHAQKAGATGVRSIRLRIGYGRDIEERLLTGAFAWMSRGTVLEGAELVIERVPFMVRCRRCGMVYHLDVHDEASWACPACGARDYKLHSGMEFSVESIEVTRAPRQAAVAAA